jgi:hypothetical protein
MEIGPVLTRGTVWMALTLYVASEVVNARRPSLSSRLNAFSRWLNPLGGAAFLAHVVCAFHFYHGWSHAAAYAETARQTSQYFGWNWGGGLYFNYLFLLFWMAQIVLGWGRPRPGMPRVTWRTWLGRAFIFMMIVNGAVVFAHGPMRWFGLVLCVILAVCWLRTRR